MFHEILYQTTYNSRGLDLTTYEIVAYENRNMSTFPSKLEEITVAPAENQSILDESYSSLNLAEIFMG